MLPRRIGRITKTLHRGAACIHVHQVKRKLFSSFAGLGKRARPIARVQARETRAGTLGPHIARHSVELLYGNIELIALRVFKQQIVAHDARDLLAHEVFEECDAMGGMDHVIARLERKRDLGYVDAAAVADARVAPLGIMDGYKGEFCLGDNHAERNIHVYHVHHAGAQKRLLARHGIKHFGNGQLVVHEQKLHILASTHIGNAEHHGIALVDQAANARDHLVGIAGDIGALDGQLGIKYAPHAHDRCEREAHALAKPKFGGFDVKAFGGDMASLRPFYGIVVSMRSVVDETARFVEDRKHIGSCIIAERFHFGIEVWQKRVCAGEIAASLQLAEELAPYGIVFCLFNDGALSSLNVFRGQAVLAHRIHIEGIERRYGLTRSGHNAANLVDLISKEVDSYGVNGVAWKHIYRAAARAERSRASQLARVVVAARNESSHRAVEIEHLARAEVDALGPRRQTKGGENARFVRGQTPGHGSGTRNNNHRSARLKRPSGTSAVRHLARTRILGSKRIIGARRKMSHRLLTYVCRDASCETLRSLLAWNGNEVAARPQREKSRRDKRARG